MSKCESFSASRRSRPRAHNEIDIPRDIHADTHQTYRNTHSKSRARILQRSMFECMHIYQSRGSCERERRIPTNPREVQMKMSLLTLPHPPTFHPIIQPPLSALTGAIMYLAFYHNNTCTHTHAPKSVSCMCLCASVTGCTNKVPKIFGRLRGDEADLV